MSSLILKLDLKVPTCRICLQNQHNGDEKMFPIFEEEIAEKIFRCTGIKIQDHEKLPSLICRNCITFLNIAFKFRAICHNSQNYLQEYFFGLISHERQDTAATNCEQVHVQEPDRIQHNQSTNGREEMQEYFVEEIELSNSNTLSSKTRKEVPQQSESETTRDFYEECWLDGEESSNKIIDIRLSANNLNNSSTNVPSKILGMSSDGAAIIEEKSSALHSKKKEKGKQVHVCDLCGNVYEKRYALQAHIRRHRDEKPFECEICGQAFHCNFELSRHIRKHTGIRPFGCSYCKRSFGDRSTLMRHERIHRNERPYSCETCGKTFTYSSVLKVHQLTHTGEKPYSCELCGKRFSRSHHLRSHLETLLHSNDPRSKILLKQIKRAEENMNTSPTINSSA